MDSYEIAIAANNIEVSTFLTIKGLDHKSEHPRWYARKFFNVILRKINKRGFLTFDLSTANSIMIVLEHPNIPKLIMSFL